MEELLKQYKEKNKGTFEGANKPSWAFAVDDLCTFVTGRQRARAGEEPGELGVLRTKLLKFLDTSRYYVAAEHISSFPQDGTCVCMGCEMRWERVKGEGRMDGLKVTGQKDEQLLLECQA